MFCRHVFTRNPARSPYTAVTASTHRCSFVLNAPIWNEKQLKLINNVTLRFKLDRIFDSHHKCTLPMGSLVRNKCFLFNHLSSLTAHCECLCISYSFKALVLALKIGLSRYSKTVRFPVMISTDAVIPGMIGKSAS